MSGDSVVIDIEDMKENTNIINPDNLTEYEDWFWSVMEEFSNDDKSNLTAFLRDNSGSKLRVVLVGADSRVINGQSFFPENMIVSEQKKYIFNAIEVSAAIESLNY